MQPELERALIRKCKAGDARFYEPLVRAYEPSGLRLAAGMLGNLEDARDALQDAFVKAFDALHRFDLRRPFGPWFFQILRNHCRDMLRSRQARFKVETLDENLELRPADSEKGPERVRQRAAARDLLWSALERVGDEHREILVLRELEGFSGEEVAELLEITLAAMKSRLHRARLRFVAALREVANG